MCSERQLTAHCRHPRSILPVNPSTRAVTHFKKSPPIFPHSSHPCHTFRAPAAGWNVNVLVQVGGRPFGICRNVRQGSGGGGGHRGSAGGRVSLRRVQSQPPDRLLFRGRRKADARSGKTGAGLWRTCEDLTFSVRAGSPKPTRAVSPDRDRSNPGGNLVDKPALRRARRRLSDADIIRRSSGRAQVAPPISYFP